MQLYAFLIYRFRLANASSSFVAESEALSFEKASGTPLSHARTIGVPHRWGRRERITRSGRQTDVLGAVGAGTRPNGILIHKKTTQISAVAITERTNTSPMERLRFPVPRLFGANLHAK